MGFLVDRCILIIGLLSSRSIAYGTANACRREGAELVFTYVGERFKDRITEFAIEFDSELVFDCDVNSDGQIAKVFEDLGQHWGHSDGLVHSVGFASREAIAGNFIDGLPRESFHIAYDTSVYSFPALVKAVPPMLSPIAPLLALTYLDAERIVPNYNMMGLAKASLGANVRYLVDALGPKGIRANGILAGPIRTFAISGIKDFGKLLKYMGDVAPLCRNVTIEEVGSVAAFLLSNPASGVTGEITYVDCGFNATAGVPKSIGQD